MKIEVKTPERVFEIKMVVSRTELIYFREVITTTAEGDCSMHSGIRKDICKELTEALANA